MSVYRLSMQELVWCSPHPLPHPQRATSLPCVMGRASLSKAACPPLPGLGGPGWVEEKWVSPVAMVTAAAPCQPSHLLTTNLTEELFCPTCRDGGQESGTGGWSGDECVCIQAHTSACPEPVCVPQPQTPKTQVRHFPLPCPLKVGLFPPLWAGQGPRRAVCVSVHGCLHIYESAKACGVSVAASVYLCLGGACASLWTHVIMSLSVYHLSGSVGCVITHLKSSAFCLSLCVCIALCVGVRLGGDKGHRIRRGAGMVLPVQAGCAPSAQSTSPITCLSCHLPIFS